MPTTHDLLYAMSGSASLPHSITKEKHAVAKTMFIHKFKRQPDHLYIGLVL